MGPPPLLGCSALYHTHQPPFVHQQRLNSCHFLPPPKPVLRSSRIKCRFSLSGSGRVLVRVLRVLRPLRWLAFCRGYARRRGFLARVLHYLPLIGRAKSPRRLFNSLRATMLPRSVICEDCGQIATVRGYGRIEYDWPETTKAGSKPSTPTINCIRLTVDCPRCGVKSQEFFPTESSQAAESFTAAAARRDAINRRRDIRLRRTGPAKQWRFGVG